MFYVGLDIHLRRIAVCVLNESGQIVRRTQVRTTPELTEILESLPDRFEVCYESELRLRPFPRHPPTPGRANAGGSPGSTAIVYRSKNKNDRQDAERLAKLLYLAGRPTGAT
jgi:hypothetical protein